MIIANMGDSEAIDVDVEFNEFEDECQHEAGDVEMKDISESETRPDGHDSPFDHKQRIGDKHRKSGESQERSSNIKSKDKLRSKHKTGSEMQDNHGSRGHRHGHGDSGHGAAAAGAEQNGTSTLVTGDGLTEDREADQDRRRRDLRFMIELKYGQKRDKKDKLFKILDAHDKVDPQILGREIAYRLGEPKSGVITSAVRILGFRTAMAILDDTRRIETSGGLLTADSKRRRTPGGVFIYCLKERGYASKEQLDEIFKDEMERVKAQQKEKKRRKRERDRKKIEELKERKRKLLKEAEEYNRQFGCPNDKKNTSENIKEEENVT